MNTPRRPKFMLVKALAGLCLAVSLCLALPAPAALAEVLSTDLIGSQTIGQRALTIADAPDVDAECALLVDSSGTVLMSRSADSSHSIASITKVMTAVVALENMDLDSIITVSANAASVGESSAYLVEGSELSLLTLLHGMLIQSGNDAATAIAQGVGGNVDTFVQMMNDKAADLGMDSTHYVDPNGLDDETKSTAEDLVILMRYAMKNETFRSIVCIASEEIDLGSGLETIENTNELLDEYEGCIGIKTGTTDLAGNCLAAAASRDGLELYSVVLGSSGYSTRFTTTENLFDWAYKHYVYVTLSTQGQEVAEVPHSEWTDKTVTAVCESDIGSYLLDFDGAVHQQLTFNEIQGDVKQGDVIGSVVWTQGDKVVSTSRLLAAQDLDAPNIFQKIGIWFKRTFTSSPDTAQLNQLVQDIEVPSAA